MDNSDLVPWFNARSSSKLIPLLFGIEWYKDRTGLNCERIIMRNQLFLIRIIHWQQKLKLDIQLD